MFEKPFRYPTRNSSLTNYFFCISRTIRPAIVPASRPSYTLKFNLVWSPEGERERDKNALLEIGQGVQLEDDLNPATSGDVDCLDSILAISRSQNWWVIRTINEHQGDLPDVGAFNANAFEDGEEDGRFEVSRPRQADGHESSTGTEVINCLCVARGAGSGDDGRVSTIPAGDALDVRDEVLGLLKVYPSFCSETECQFLLILAGILSRTGRRETSQTTNGRSGWSKLYHSPMAITRRPLAAAY